MSQFDRYTSAERVDAMRVFLAEPRREFMKKAGFISPRKTGSGKGRLPMYAEAPLLALDARVNAKAARCEANDTTFGERLMLARDYAGMSDSQVAAALGVSREMVRRWVANINGTTRTTELAELLGVPEVWLTQGGEQNLPANTHLGVRVGGVYYKEVDGKRVVSHVGENARCRERLYSLTQSVLAELPDDATESYTQAYIEWAVFNRFELAQWARRAGGRWQIVSNRLLFSPWIPIQEHGLTRRLWSDEVEAIIQEELATHPTVPAAHAAIAARCTALGLSSSEFPKQITLHKRLEKERERAELYGVDLNEIVAAAVQEHADT